jgi:hypothetical protein
VVGESVTFSKTVAVNSVWVRSRIYALAMLQETDHTLVQAAKSAKLPDAMGVTVTEPGSEVVLYPNPSHSKVFFNELKNYPFTVDIYEVSGRLLSRTMMHGAASFIDISGLAPGLYLVKGAADGNPFVRSFVKN